MTKRNVNTSPKPQKEAEGLRILARLIVKKYLNAFNEKYQQYTGKDRDENLPGT